MKLDDEKTIFASGTVMLIVGLTVLTNWLPGIIPALPSCLTALTAVAAAFLGSSVWHSYNEMNQPNYGVPSIPMVPGVQVNVQESPDLHSGGGPAE